MAIILTGCKKAQENLVPDINRFMSFSAVLPWFLLPKYIRRNAI